MIPEEFKSKYYNRKGEVIPLNEWAELFEDYKYKIVRQDQIGKFFVSTVWLGMDHNFFRFMEKEAPIYIFETMIFADDDYGDIYQVRYSTEEEALAGHLVAIEEAKSMSNKTEDV
jgi:hypothetical protein